VRDAGPIPTVTPSSGREQARLNADEFRRYKAALMALLEPLLASKQRGYLPAAEFDRMRRLQAANRKAHDARIHSARIKTLRAVVGHLPAPDATPIAVVAHETHAAIATAAPIADAPFTLTSTPAPTRAPRQTSLF
jgi:hypothetical protein